MISVLGAAYASVLARIRRGSQISRVSTFIAGLSISGAAPSLARLRLWGGLVQAHVSVGDACVEILLGADAEAETLIETQGMGLGGQLQPRQAHAAGMGHDRAHQQLAQPLSTGLGKQGHATDTTIREKAGGTEGAPPE